MIYEVVTKTNIIFHLMIAVGVMGIMAKLVNVITLRRMLGAAANMQKSTHKLIKLVRSKYEHACMLHDSVNNTGAFVEKYIYEYRGNILKLHTWRQIERQSVWAAGILAAVGAFVSYRVHGIGEGLYQYAMVGVAEMILLFVVGQVSDETYKINAVKNYMVDYLENVCAFRYKRQRQLEREQIDVIHTDTATANRSNAGLEEGNVGLTTEELEVGGQKAKASNLSINIEGNPRKLQKGESVVQKQAGDKRETEDEPQLREETIRQILEEFLA